MRGTGSGAPGFGLLNARFLGAQVDNPTDTFYVSLNQRRPDTTRRNEGNQGRCGVVGGLVNHVP
ncbi:unnamed protein product [Scytosiphon promiscuus]